MKNEESRENESVSMNSSSTGTISVGRYRESPKVENSQNFNNKNFQHITSQIEAFKDELKILRKPLNITIPQELKTIQDAVKQLQIDTKSNTSDTLRLEDKIKEDEIKEDAWEERVENQIDFLTERYDAIWDIVIEDNPINNSRQGSGRGSKFRRGGRYR